LIAYFVRLWQDRRGFPAPLREFGAFFKETPVEETLTKFKRLIKVKIVSRAILHGERRKISITKTKKTLPFLNTAVGEEIDFSRTDPISEYSKEKGISEREAATRDILGNESLVKSIQRADKELRKGCRLLTWNEVSGG